MAIINARRSHFMERKIVEKLIKWMNSAKRMPLLIYGARQVGKTYTALTFGKQHYKNTVYFNSQILLRGSTGVSYHRGG